MSREKKLLEYYSTMARALGPSCWWPGDSPFEVALGAILTQNTAWRNVEKAILRLRERDALVPARAAALSFEELEYCVYPSGFYRQKALRVRSLLTYLHSQCTSDEEFFDPHLGFLAQRETESLRAELLEIKGIGPETADSILLYALQRPVFVVDAYTKRIFSRHGLVPEEVSYQELQEFFSDVLEPEPGLFNEYHALIVRVGNEFCKKSKPRCGECPLGCFLEYSVDA